MRTIFHIDANSAYLSWTAAAMLEKGYPIDIREIPAVISGDPLNRHGIILAKSIPAKKYGIATGQSLFEARQKYPELAVFPPNYDLYMLCSNAMYRILLEYSPLVERYSIANAFGLYCVAEQIRNPLDVAQAQDRIKEELGFTVNMAYPAKAPGKDGFRAEEAGSDSYPLAGGNGKEIGPLPVGELYMVGRATAGSCSKSYQYHRRPGEADPNHMQALLKSPGFWSGICKRRR